MSVKPNVTERIANIQPGNTASTALVRRAGFRLEGISHRYLKINGRLRNHERGPIPGDDPR
jgi:[ribosomal protein S5]-alanine N-acetyltransferase